jgi:hypothetical protein
MILENILGFIYEVVLSGSGMICKFVPINGFHIDFLHESFKNTIPLGLSQIVKNQL